jgi:RND family efflux transporter MFP subunit
MESFAAKREAAQAQISYAEVHAPIAGVVADRPLFAGEMATPGTPLLTIVNVSSVIARVNLPQEAASHVRVGQKAHIGATDGSVETEGRVTVVSPAIDPQGTTVEVWVQASNPGTQLRPGGTVHVQIFAEKVQDALVVPASALLPGEEGGTILLAVGADNVAHVKKVQAGIRTAELAQILSGAEAGMKVVVSGGVGIEDGGKVKVETAGEKKESGKPDEDQKGTGQGRRT